MVVSVTGANGFLASYLIDILIGEGIEVILLSRNEGEKAGIRFTKTDYSESSLTECIKNSDAIVHLASPRMVYENFSGYYDAIDMTENLYRTALNCGIKNIIYASSISVYSGDELPYCERNIANPANYYGVYKLVCEKIGDVYSAKGLFVKNLRFAHIYGANENNNYMINVFLRNAYEHKGLNVFAKSYARREMLYAKDAASAIMKALKNPQQKGVFNIGSGDFLTNSDIAEAICKEFSPELRVKYGDKIETVSSSYMDIKKAEKELGYAPQFSIEEAVKEIKLDMIRARG